MPGITNMNSRRMLGEEAGSLNRPTKPVVPVFLQKLYEIVNNPENSNVIKWSDRGDSFYVKDQQRFCHEVLGRWFKHQKFTSFVRQLNMYGFRKIPHLQQGTLRSECDTEFYHFEHQHFNRGQPEFLCYIQRKKQPASGGVDKQSMELKQTAMPSHSPESQCAPQLRSNAQPKDISSIAKGISAMRNHQDEIHNDVCSLKTSMQELQMEMKGITQASLKREDIMNIIVAVLMGLKGKGKDSLEKLLTSGPGDFTQNHRGFRQSLDLCRHGPGFHPEFEASQDSDQTMVSNMIEEIIKGETPPTSPSQSEIGTLPEPPALFDLVGQQTLSTVGSHRHHPYLSPGKKQTRWSKSSSPTTSSGKSMPPHTLEASYGQFQRSPVYDDMATYRTSFQGGVISPSGSSCSTPLQDYNMRNEAFMQSINGLNIVHNQRSGINKDNGAIQHNIASLIQDCGSHNLDTRNEELEAACGYMESQNPLSTLGQMSSEIHDTSPYELQNFLETFKI